MRVCQTIAITNLTCTFLRNTIKEVVSLFVLYGLFTYMIGMYTKENLSLLVSQQLGQVS